MAGRLTRPPAEALNPRQSPSLPLPEAKQTRSLPSSSDLARYGASRSARSRQEKDDSPNISPAHKTPRVGLGMPSTLDSPPAMAKRSFVQRCQLQLSKALAQASMNRPRPPTAQAHFKPQKSTDDEGAENRCRHSSAHEAMQIFRMYCSSASMDGSLWRRRTSTSCVHLKNHRAILPRMCSMTTEKTKLIARTRTTTGSLYWRIAALNGSREAQDRSI